MTKLEEVQFLNSHTGEYAFTNDFGEVTSRGFYKDGNKHGIWHEFQDGEIIREETYVDGVRHGVCKSYHKSIYDENSTRFLTDITNFKHGVKHGERIQYNHDGSVNTTLNYKNDKLHGLEVRLNEDGSKSSTKIYFEGDLVSYQYYSAGKVVSDVQYLTSNLSLRNNTSDEGSFTEINLNAEPYSMTYNDGDVAIGCKHKTVAEWDEWFAGTEIFSTERDTVRFAKIESNFNRFKEILLEQSVIK